MKMNTKMLPALLAGIVTITSCGSDAIIEDESRPYAQTSAQGTLTFTATTGEESGTRASLDSLDIVWNAGDALSLFSSADFSVNNKLTLTAGVGTASGSFKGDCAKGTEYFAFYPYNSGNKFEKASPNAPKNLYTIVWDGLQQTAVDGSFDPRTPMLARTVGVEEGATSVPLQFKNVLSFVKLTTDFTCRSITLTSKNNKEYLAAKQLVFDIPATGVPTLFTKIEYSHSLALHGADDALIAAGTYYIAVLPGTLSQGFELTFTGINDSDLTQTRSTSKSVTLNRSEVLNLGEIKLNDFKQNLFFGSGTEADPYRITSYDDWVLLSSKLNSSESDSYRSKSYVLTNDIDCQDKNPLTPFVWFTGHFDGKGHSIRNYYINAAVVENKTYQIRTGLFIYIEGATIENLNAVFRGFVNVDTSGRYSIDFSLIGPTNSEEAQDFRFSPFICTSSRSTVINCHLSGAVPNYYLNITNKVRSFEFGCLICEIWESGTVRNCSNSLSIDINAQAFTYTYPVSLGGIVCNVYAEDKAVKIDRCRNTGNLWLRGLNNLFAGGIVTEVADRLAYDVELYITNCVNTGNVWAGVLGEESTYSDDAIAGGIVGYLDSDGDKIVPHIYNCLNTGSILASQVDKSYAGGIIGEAYLPSLYHAPHLFNCANRGEIRSSGGHNYPFVGNKGDYSSDYAKCCLNDYKFGSEPQVPQIIADDMNANIGSAKIHSVTNNDEKWVDYSFGCCRWTGDGATLDLDFSTSVQ